ncbi:MAG: heparinase, partial [Bacteroidetes bacterium]
MVWAMGWGQSHPGLTLTPEEVAFVRSHLGKVPLFDRQIQRLRAEVDAEIRAGVFVPVPKDMAGGYTHERHKRNFFVLQMAGNLYQLTGEERYAAYVREVLLEYARLFPTLDLHPTRRSYATGKIFWQCLNDANWLVYVSQAYDCVYDYLSAEERQTLERDLFRPLADFLSVENPQFFNRIHNHSTWGNAAVGMIGLVMGDEELVNRALYGLEWANIPEDLRDNDGGFIRIEGQTKAGFLAQLDYSFSPDGYFTEGPYYLRYAIFPFLVFARALERHRPELGIFDYRDGILRKAVYALLNLTDAQGRFFPINDAQKGMSWQAREVVTAVDVLYALEEDPALLSIAALQGRVLPDAAGLKVALALQQGRAQPFVRRSIVYRDGPDGTGGGIGLLRGRRDSALTLLLKYTNHGMGHGHFDRLSISLYDAQGEVLQDYGSARWVNIDQKGGGRYLPENQTWAKQTIAHNTVAVDERSQCDGEVKTAEASHPQFFCFRTDHPDWQALAARDDRAYPGVDLHRTVLLVEDEDLRQPLLIDVFHCAADSPRRYDLPWWFQGHLLSTGFDYHAETRRLQPLGAHDGYQHLWVEARGAAADSTLQLT